MALPIALGDGSRIVVRSVVTCLFFCIADASSRADPPELDEPPEAAFEVLARGPVHEAFAAVTGRDAQRGAVAPRQPPEPVEELPPEVQPEGNNVQWIPGYWAWDEEQEDFIWVSGVWRNVPPGRRWVPGNWTEVKDGFVWISGFWSDADNDVPPPLPAPPDRPDEQPPGEPPDDDHFWLPGCWIYQNNVYVWRAGYWTRFWPNWIWVPSYYVWTPAGCLYVSGYWDYSLAYRGFLYAPIRFRHPVFRQRLFRFRPGHCIDVARIHLHLFVHPRRGHYLFGDYHGDHYARRGYCSHLRYHLSRRGHDCLFSYYQTLYRRRGFDYGRRVQGWHDYYAKHREHCPPRTKRAQQEVVRKVARRHPRQSFLVQPIDDIGRRVPRGSTAADRLRRARSQAPAISDRARDALRNADAASQRSRDVVRHRVETLREKARDPAPLQDKALRPFVRGRSPDVASSDELSTPRQDVRLPARRRALPDTVARSGSSTPSLARQRTSDAWRRGAAGAGSRQAEHIRQLHKRATAVRGAAADRRRIMEHVQRFRSSARAGGSRAPDVSALRRHALGAAPTARGRGSLTRGHSSVPSVRRGFSQSFKSRVPSSVMRGRSLPSRGRAGITGGPAGRAGGRGGRR